MKRQLAKKQAKQIQQAPEEKKSMKQKEPEEQFVPERAAQAGIVSRKKM